MDLNHLKNAEFATHLQNLRSESCSGKTTSQTKKDTEQPSFQLLGMCDALAPHTQVEITDAPKWLKIVDGRMS